MSRVKFCPDCDEVLPWDAATCKACGVAQPADPRALEKIRDAKAREIEKLRSASRSAAPPRTASAPMPASPTTNVIALAVISFVLGAILFVVSTRPSGKPTVTFPLSMLLFAVANLATLWVIIHTAVVSAIRRTRAPQIPVAAPARNP